MNEKIILVDVDLTVEQSVGLRWAEWLKNRTGSYYDPHKDPCIQNGDISYNLSHYYMDNCIRLEVDPFEFWRQTDLYDSSVPAEGSVEVLEELKSWGYNIAFVSLVKSGQLKGKYGFLKKHYGHVMSGFLGTHEKWLVRGDVLIDDRNSHLDSMPNGVKLVKLDTPYTQDKPLRKEHLEYNWGMGSDILVRYIEGGKLC